MAKRSYEQYCPAARSLDVVGDRWTLLVVRELLPGPKRYTDLLAGLPGIAPNVLADRLRQMQDARLVRRATLPPPAASQVYELTPLGDGLRPVLLELSRWGYNFLGAPQPGDSFQLGWLLASLEAMFRPDAARGVHETYEFTIDGETFHIRVDDGSVEIARGAAEDPDFRSAMDLTTFTAIGARMITPEEAAAGGRATYEGDLEAGRRSVEILGPHLGGEERTGGVLGAVRALVRPEAAAGVRESYEFSVDGFVFHLDVDDGRVDVEWGAADDPACSTRMDLATFLEFPAGRLTIEAALAEGRVSVEGDMEAAMRAAAVTGIAEPVPTAA